MGQTAVVMIGHSHLGAVIDALGQRQPSSDISNPIHYYVHDVWANNTQYAFPDGNGGVAFNQELLQTIHDIVIEDRQPRYITFFGGNGHIVLALSKHPRPFDFVLPERPDLPLEADAEILPYSYISKILLQQMGSYIWQLIAFRQAISRRCYCVETPPPCGDDQYLRTHLGTYVPDPGNVIGRDLRWKMWRLHSRLLREICEANDIEFVAVPEAVCDENQFLNPKAYGIDATHGNAWYGEVLLSRFDELIGGHYAAWTRFV